MSVIEPSDEGEEQAEEKQKSTPGAVMKHWYCDDTSNDIVLPLSNCFATDLMPLLM